MSQAQPNQALYRKYRPQVFADVINQEHIKLTLQNQIKSGRVAHAYLFAGPRGVGKTTLARIFAKDINHITDVRQLDIIEIDAASHTGVDNVRENIIQNAYVAPAQLKYKVFIIDEVHMLSVSAFNALLKILEEPPAHVVFILATTEAHRLPATVISRCQRFDFQTIKLADMVKRLQWMCEQEQVAVEPVVLERIARKAQGAARDAESLLGQLLAAGDNHITNELADVVLPRVDLAIAVELFTHLIQRQPKLYTATVASAVQSGAQMKELWQLMLELFRRGLLYSVDQSLSHLEDLDMHLSTHEQLISLLNQLSSRDYLRLLDLFVEAGELYQRSPISQLIIEVPGLEWCISGQPQPQPSQSVVVQKPTAGKPPKRLELKSDDTMLAAVKEQWPTALQKTKEVNHALAMALSVAHVVAASSDGQIQLGFRYGFHKDRVCQPEYIRAITAILKQLVGHDVTVECIVGEQYDIDVSVLNNLPSDNIAGVNPAELDNVWDLALEKPPLHSS